MRVIPELKLETRTVSGVVEMQNVSCAGMQLRLHLMRKQLKEAEADSKPLQGYSCPGCGASYSSMDAPRLLDFVTGEFHCEDCKYGFS